jgi:hypothetical protein
MLEIFHHTILIDCIRFLPNIIIGAILIYSLAKNSNQNAFSINETVATSLLTRQILQFVEKIHTPLCWFAVLLLLGTPDRILHSCAASIILIIIATGIFAKKLNVISDCNCFGATVEQNSGVGKILFWLLLISTFAILLDGKTALFSEIDMHAKYQPLLLGFFVIITHTVFSDNRKSSIAHYLVPKAGTLKLSLDTVLGSDENNADVALADFNIDCPLMIFIGLNKDCQECKRSKDHFFAIANAFPEKIGVVFLMDGTPDGINWQQNACILQIDNSLKYTLSIMGFPFGILFETASMTQIGATVYSPDSIWALIFAGLNILEPVKPPLQ